MFLSNSDINFRVILFAISLVDTMPFKLTKNVELFYKFKTNNEYNILHSQSYYLRKIKEKQLSLTFAFFCFF